MNLLLIDLCGLINTKLRWATYDTNRIKTDKATRTYSAHVEWADLVIAGGFKPVTKTRDPEGFGLLVIKYQGAELLNHFVT